MMRSHFSFKIIEWILMKFVIGCLHCNLLHELFILVCLGHI